MPLTLPTVLLHPKQPGQLPSGPGRRGEGQSQVPRTPRLLLLRHDSGEREQRPVPAPLRAPEPPLLALLAHLPADRRPAHHRHGEDQPVPVHPGGPEVDPRAPRHLSGCRGLVGPRGRSRLGPMLPLLPSPPRPPVPASRCMMAFRKPLS